MKVVLEVADVEALMAASGHDPEPERLPAPRLLLTVEEAAEQLGLGRTGTWKLVSTGELESVLLGRLRRVPVECLQDYVARLRRQHREEAS